MQSLTKFPQFSIKHVEPIKIRKVRVSSRKLKESIKYSERTTTSENINSTRKTKNSESLLRSNISQATRTIINSKNLSFKEYFGGIKEIYENPENEEDSVILELNELLSQIHLEKKPSFKDLKKKPPLANLKFKMKNKIKPVKTERRLSRVLSSMELT